MVIYRGIQNEGNVTTFFPSAEVSEHVFKFLRANVNAEFVWLKEMIMEMDVAYYADERTALLEDILKFVNIVDDSETQVIHELNRIVHLINDAISKDHDIYVWST